MSGIHGNARMRVVAVVCMLLFARAAPAATPPRLVELECPKCQATHWEIDHDYRGMDGYYEPYEKRVYECPNCRHSGTGYHVLEKSPPEFFLQPHPMYPMSQADFDFWVSVLRKHFPDHPMLQKLGSGFKPNTKLPTKPGLEEAK